MAVIVCENSGTAGPIFMSFGGVLLTVGDNEDCTEFKGCK